MPNNRIFYATRKAGIAPLGSNSHTTLRGVQSIGMTTNFNLIAAFEVGQISVYENIEGIPDVQVTMERLLDGTPPIYCLATQQGTSATLVGRSASQCHLAVSTYPDTSLNANGSIPGAEVKLSGLYVSSVGYQVNVTDNATESVSLVGNDKTWVSLVAGTSFASYTDANAFTTVTGPKSLSGSGGVNRKEDVLFTYTGTGRDANGAISGNGTVLPTHIPGVSASGTNNATAGIYNARLQSFSCNVDLGREDLFELGRRGPYFKYVNFPVEVTTEIAVIAASGDLISATADGINAGVGCGGGTNLTDQTIRLHMCEGLQVDLGKKNKLSSTSESGGDANGGNVEVTYTYTNQNDFSVYHNADPSRTVAGFDPAGVF